MARRSCGPTPDQVAPSGFLRSRRPREHLPWGAPEPPARRDASLSARVQAHGRQLRGSQMLWMYPCLHCLEMHVEPLCGKVDDLVESARLLEQMCRAGNDLETLLAGEHIESFLVKIDDTMVGAADDQQRRGAHPLER